MTAAAPGGRDVDRLSALQDLGDQRVEADHSATVTLTSSAPRTSVIARSPVVPSASNRSSALVIGRLADRDDEVALGDAGLRGGGVVLHLANQEAVALGQADRAPQAPGDVRRREADAEPAPGGRLAATERRDAVAQRGIGHDGLVEPVAEPVRVDPDQVAHRGRRSGHRTMPGMSGAVCSIAPATRRPRGPRKERPTPLTKPKVTRGP